MKNILLTILVLVWGFFVLYRVDDPTKNLSTDEKVKMICEVSNNPDVVDLCKQKRENLTLCEKEPVWSEWYERCVANHEQLVWLILSF